MTRHWNLSKKHQPRSSRWLRMILQVSASPVSQAWPYTRSNYFRGIPLQKRKSIKWEKIQPFSVCFQRFWMISETAILSCHVPHPSCRRSAFDATAGPARLETASWPMITYIYTQCVYIYIHICVLIYWIIYLFMYIYIYIYSFLYICIHDSICIYVCKYVWRLLDMTAKDIALQKQPQPILPYHVFICP